MSFLNIIYINSFYIKKKTFTQKETQARTEDSDKKSSNNISKVASQPIPEDASAASESDFESEIPSEMSPSASEISESLPDEDKDASLVSESQHCDDNDHTLSQSSDSSSRSSSSNATVTHGHSHDRHVKEAAVQTQTYGLTYTWSSGRFALSYTSVQTTFLCGIPQGYSLRPLCS